MHKDLISQFEQAVTDGDHLLTVDLAEKLYLLRKGEMIPDEIISGIVRLLNQAARKKSDVTGQMKILLGVH